MQRHDLPQAAEPDVAARNTEIRMQERADRDRREAAV